MNKNALIDLIEEGRFDELDNFWLEQMETGEYSVEDFLLAGRALGRQKEKDRAGLLLGLLADHYQQKEQWTDRLRVLTELARHCHDSAKFEEIRDHIRGTLQRIYPDRPSFEQILRHYRFDKITAGEELKASLKKIEWWLSHDAGQIFFQPGYGTGRVREINLNLGLLRIDFEVRKDVTVQAGDTELIALPKGHLLREKFESPEQVRRAADENAGAVLGRLLHDLGRAMSVSEIKESMGEIIPSTQWAKWWTTARKHPQIMVSGKGTQATYSWTDSESIAEDSVKAAFEQGDLRTKIEMARQYADRGGELALLFSTTLTREAELAYKESRFDLALELLDLLSRLPSALRKDIGYSVEDILRQSDPQMLLPKIENSMLKLKLLEAMQQYRTDWTAVFSAQFLREENPRVHSYLYDHLSRQAPEKLEIVLDRVLEHEYLHPAAFSWICQNAAAEGLDLAADRIGRRLDSKFLISILKAIDQPEFASHRNKIKKSLESGLLVNILSKPVDPDAAQKAVDILEHSRNIEDYRKERWRSVLIARFPQMKKKEEVIFSTKEALDRKRAELEHLIKVELPKNRKAIGEAAAHGDLSENFEYKAARERQDYLINRVAQLQGELQMVRVLEPSQIDCSQVRAGTSLTLAQRDKKLKVTILGPWDSNPLEGVYSYQSPLAVRILGKVPGEEVSWNEQTWIIEKIEPWK